MSIAAIHGDDGRLTTDPRKNTASAAVLALLQRLETTRGVSLTIHKGLPLASGIGSSGASAVAAVVAANELLGRPAPLDVLLECAMAGEQAGCGADASRQRHTVVVRRLHPRAERATARHRSPAGARRTGVRGSASADGSRNRRGAKAARRSGGAEGRSTGSGPMSAGSSRRSTHRICALLSRSLVDSIAEPKRASAGAGILRREGRRASPPARSAAACRARARRSSRSPPRSRSPGPPATPCSVRSTRHSTVGSDLWVCPVGRQGARIVLMNVHLRTTRARRRRVSLKEAVLAGTRARTAASMCPRIDSANAGGLVVGASRQVVSRHRDRHGASSWPATSSITPPSRIWFATRSTSRFASSSSSMASASSSCFTGRRSRSRTSARARSRGSWP